MMKEHYQRLKPVIVVFTISPRTVILGLSVPARVDDRYFISLVNLRWEGEGKDTSNYFIPFIEHQFVDEYPARSIEFYRVYNALPPKLLHLAKITQWFPQV
jgi:hypothetical protein